MLLIQIMILDLKRLRPLRPIVAPPYLESRQLILQHYRSRKPCEWSSNSCRVHSWTCSLKGCCESIVIKLKSCYIVSHLSAFFPFFSSCSFRPLKSRHRDSKSLTLSLPFPRGHLASFLPCSNSLHISTTPFPLLLCTALRGSKLVSLCLIFTCLVPGRLIMTLSSLPCSRFSKVGLSSPRIFSLPFLLPLPSSHVRCDVISRHTLGEIIDNRNGSRAARPPTDVSNVSIQSCRMISG